MRRELGDFQTPPALVAAVLDVLGPIGARWTRVLEPTCGQGHFLKGLIASAAPPREVQGIEIQGSHAAEARMVAAGAGSIRVEITQSSLFDLDLRRDLNWRERGPLLVIGNPPWVTNSELGVLGSTNLPRKHNIKGLTGIAARTGASNFDCAEAVWLKLFAELADQAPTIALLCKTSVARSVLEFAHRSALSVTEASLHKIDAARWFRATVDACLLRIQLGPGARFARVPVFSTLAANAPTSTLGFARGRMIAHIDAYPLSAFADGTCPLVWRQGVKHDAASVMELSATIPPRNRLGAAVDVESEFVYPLLKGSDLARPVLEPARAVIVTQERIGQDTRRLEHDAPRLWRYLGGHEAIFTKRKSSIYQGRPPFGLFGIGPYSFAPYKVAVSGLRKTPWFRALGSVAGRPVMLDDTCYFLPCRSPEQAALVVALLDGPSVHILIAALAFRDAKRPTTKALLQRIDLNAILDRAGPSALLARATVEHARLAASVPNWPDRLADLLVDEYVEHRDRVAAMKKQSLMIFKES